MVPVKTTAAVLVASMSLFSAVPASAAGLLEVPGRRTANGPAPAGPSGNTPITGSQPGGSGPVGSGAPASGGAAPGTVGSGSSAGGGANGGASPVGSGTGSIGSPATSGPSGSTASPVNSGNRGTNTPRPGPRNPAEGPSAGGTGPFGEAPVPRTMDGTENAGFNFGNILSGLYSFTGTLMQLMMTFAMLKQMFGWFEKKPATGSELVKEVAAAPDRGSNVSRDDRTKTDEDLERERARAEGTDGASGEENAEDAEKAGLARE